jgi:hypothetical protein
LFISATLAQENKPNYVAENYTKKEVHIKCVMERVVYCNLLSKDVSKNILSSCNDAYNAAPYGATEFKKALVLVKL